MNNIDQIAVFVDIENVINFCTDMQMPIDLTDVLNRLKEEGKITIRRSFGDIKKATEKALERNGHNSEEEYRQQEYRVRRMLKDNLFIHEDMLYLHDHKNSADMRLALEALHTVFLIPGITKFAIISGDSDFVPLFAKLREQNRTVIGITGSKKSTAVTYKNSCDSLFYFEDLFETSMSPAIVSPALQTEAGESPAAIPEHIGSDQELKDQYANLLVKALEVLQQSGKDAAITTVYPQMRQLENDFDLQRAGFSQLTDLIKYAEQQNLVVSRQINGNLTLALPGDNAEAAQTVSTAQYRLFLKEKLKCQMPSYDLRLEICDHAFDQITYNQADGGVMLQDLSHDVTDGMLDKKINIEQPQVYKYLYSLYRSRCFRFEPTYFGEFNPKIIGLNAQKDEWDEHFVESQISLIHNWSGFKLYPDKLSKLFYGTVEKTMHIKQMLNKLGFPYERSTEVEN
jgi:uncharacterized LabA/DUF88 family protein